MTGEIVDSEVGDGLRLHYVLKQQSAQYLLVPRLISLIGSAGNVNDYHDASITKVQYIERRF